MRSSFMGLLFLSPDSAILIDAEAVVVVGSCRGFRKFNAEKFTIIENGRRVCEQVSEALIRIRASLLKQTASQFRFKIISKSPLIRPQQLNT